jgi:hypothetical protein
VTSFDFLDAAARLFKEQLTTTTSESKHVKVDRKAQRMRSAGTAL